MKSGDNLFVYGTLRRGERADINKNRLIHSVSYLSVDHINGRMYHIGAFPGVTIPLPVSEFDPAAPTVTGEVYYVGDQSVAAILDAYEGYDEVCPDRGLYNRYQVMTKNGKCVWVYTFNPTVLEDQLIETGDWKNPRLKVTHRIPKVN